MDKISHEDDKEAMRKAYLAYRAEWRRNHKESIRQSNAKYYRKLKEMKILAQASEIIAQRQREEAQLQKLANELATKVPEMKGVDGDGK